MCYNLQVNARILFVDPSTRAVGLTLNKHLLHLEVPPTVSCLVLHITCSMLSWIFPFMPVKLASIENSESAFILFPVHSWLVTLTRMQNLKAGDIYDNSKVLRIDKKAGLFLEIPSPTPIPGFISVCETAMIFWVLHCWLFARTPRLILIFWFWYLILRYMTCQTRMWRTWRRSLRKAVAYVSVYLESEILKELP